MSVGREVEGEVVWEEGYTGGPHISQDRGERRYLNAYG